MLKQCWFAHDCGRMLYPLLIEGQLFGGADQGIGNALYERTVRGADGQPRSTDYGEYLSTASDVPPFALAHRETVSPRNPLGVKEVGEFGARFDQHPIGPEDVPAAIGAIPARAGDTP